MTNAHPEDILVVAWLNEAAQYPQFSERQVVSTNATQILFGRRVRRAYLTPGCGDTPRADEFFAVLRTYPHRYGTEMRPVAEFENDYALDELELILAEANEQVTA